MEKRLCKIPKEKLLREVAKASNKDLATVQEVFSSLEDCVMNMLRKANKDNDISIRLFDGVFMEGHYTPPKQKTNNLTGKVIDVASRVKIRARISRKTAEKLVIV